MLCGYAVRNNEKVDQADRARDRQILGATFWDVYASIPRSTQYATPISCLASIKQGPNKMLKAYIKCFNDDLATIHDAPKRTGK